MTAAAFGRLCVETFDGYFCCICIRSQPPSGGCVLKLCVGNLGGCSPPQPPSGGCVLKQLEDYQEQTHKLAAAFGRLCVETF